MKIQKTIILQVNDKEVAEIKGKIEAIVEHFVEVQKLLDELGDSNIHMEMKNDNTQTR